MRVIFTMFNPITNERVQFPVMLDTKQNKGKLHGLFFKVFYLGKYIIMPQDAVETFMQQTLTKSQLRKIKTDWIF